MWTCNGADKSGYHAGNDDFKPKNRADAVTQVRAKYSFAAQLKNSMWNLLGPNQVVSAIIMYFCMKWARPVAPEEDLVFTVSAYSLWEFFLLFFVNDFFLYWGHRIQHQVKTLWENWHSFHHQIGTPTPVSTIFINEWDATLQGGMPILLAGMVVRPHPAMLAIFTAARLAENAFNHSGTRESDCQSDQTFALVVTCMVVVSCGGAGLDNLFINILALRVRS